MAEPITLAEAKQHLDILRDDQDAMIAGMIIAAREWVENYTELSLDGDEVTQAFQGFSSAMSLLVWPETDDAIVTISYMNKAGDLMQVAGARLWRAAKPARLLPPPNGAWPTDVDGTIAVTVQGVPFSLKAAMLLLLGDLYNQREETAVGVSIQASGAVENLCHPYRMPVIG
jgi:uncharacterized phiE125 gp8 family phage protein